MASNPELWVANDYSHLRRPRLVVLLDTDGHALANTEVRPDGTAVFHIEGPQVIGAWIAQAPTGGTVIHMPVNQLVTAGTYTIDTTMKQS